MDYFTTWRGQYLHRAPIRYRPLYPDAIQFLTAFGTAFIIVRKWTFVFCELHRWSSCRTKAAHATSTRIARPITSVSRMLIDCAPRAGTALSQCACSGRCDLSRGCSFCFRWSAALLAVLAGSHRLLLRLHASELRHDLAERITFLALAHNPLP